MHVQTYTVREKLASVKPMVVYVNVATLFTSSQELVCSKQPLIYPQKFRYLQLPVIKLLELGIVAQFGGKRVHLPQLTAQYFRCKHAVHFECIWSGSLHAALA